MRLELTGRQIKITPALRATVEEGLAHTLRKLNSSAVSVQVVLTREKTRMHGEATLHVKGERFLHGEAAGREPQAVLAAVLDKIDRQAQKLKSKWAEGKRRNGRAAPVAEPEAPPFAPAPRVVRARRYVVRPMSVEDAAMVVGDLPNAFVVFRDTGSDSISILFRRPDGDLGLIEPEA